MIARYSESAAGNELPPPAQSAVLPPDAQHGREPPHAMRARHQLLWLLLAALLLAAPPARAQIGGKIAHIDNIDTSNKFLQRTAHRDAPAKAGQE